MEKLLWNDPIPNRQWKKNEEEKKNILKKREWKKEKSFKFLNYQNIYLQVSLLIVVDQFWTCKILFFSFILGWFIIHVNIRMNLFYSFKAVVLCHTKNIEEYKVCKDVIILFVKLLFLFDDLLWLIFFFYIILFRIV